MKKLFSAFLLIATLILASGPASAAYVSRFDAINFDPAVDSTDYFTVYGSQTNKAWQGNLGFFFDYANRALEFRGIGGTTGRQSVIDHTFILNTYGSLGFTDWFTAGINIPFVPYNIFFTDDATAASDNGGGMGDIMLVTKFRLLDIEKHHVGVALVPYVTFPTGDIVRYNGNGHITGGAKVVVDGRIGKRFSMAMNAGYLMRDDVTRNYTFAGGGTSTIRVDDIVNFGVAANYKATKYIQIVAEAQGNTQVRNFFGSSNTTSLEAGGGTKILIGDTGLTVNVGGTAGIVEGFGTPRFRGFVGLNWKSPGPKECPECKPPEKIKDGKIVLWGKIFFDTAKATIKPVSYPVLDDVVEVMQSNPQILVVKVQGHTDSRGGDSYNMKLSQRRAQSAMKYLISKGVDPSRLVAKGYGESRPIATNSTVEGMSQNRRTEFVILSATDNSMVYNPQNVINPTDVEFDSVSPVQTSVINTVPVVQPQVAVQHVTKPIVKKVVAQPRVVKKAFQDDVPSMGSSSFQIK